MRRAIPLILCAGAAALTACHRHAEDPTAVTADEQSQLNDAAASLDANVGSASRLDGNGQSEDRP